MGLNDKAKSAANLMRTLGHDFLGPKVLAEPALTPNTVCMTLPWLSRRQLGLCARSPEAMASALQGIHLAIHECHHQLQERRWDCSDLSGSGTVLLSSAILKRVIDAIACQGCRKIVMQSTAVGTTLKHH
ncbi:UNVERIFIED_CONTAM: Protein Wnt-10b [Gekko kuhli]